MIWILSAALLAQATGTTPEANAVATRAVNLMESTAAAVPGLPQASEALRRKAENTLKAMPESAPDSTQSAILMLQHLNQLTAYLALADTFVRPDPFPQTATDQFVELRNIEDRTRRNLGALLEANIRAVRSREADPNNLQRYADADAKMAPPGTVPRVVFLGDSITDLWRLNEYFTGRDFVNRGISGQTTTQMLCRFRQDVIALHPKIVLILAGTNDIARGIPASGIEDNLNTMGDLAKAHGIKVIFGSILPVGPEVAKIRHPGDIQQVNTWLKDYCRREGFTYADYYPAMINAEGQLAADQSDDGLHPNAKGYRVMSPLALQAIERTLQTAPDQGPQQAPGRKHR